MYVTVGVTHRALVVVETFCHVVVVIVQCVVIHTTVHHVTSTTQTVCQENTVNYNEYRTATSTFRNVSLWVECLHSQWSQQFLLNHL